MQFLFEEQPHQLAATAAAVDLFEGSLLPPENTAGQLGAPGAGGHGDFRLDLEQLLANVRAVQTREGLRQDADLSLLEENDLTDKPTAFTNFSVEMETGTGKTYVYIRTCLKLAQEHGLRKFVIVVHSSAIRAGVLKTFAQTSEHFAETFPDLQYGWGTMSDNSGLDDFVDPSDSVRFLVVMVQSLDKPDTNVVYREPEAMSLWGETTSRIGVLSAMRPVLVIDEPQNMKSTTRRRALATLNPLFALRYSATHFEPFNLIHRLDARAAQNKGLVKSITVKGVAPGRDASQAFVGLIGTNARGKQIKATLRVNVPDDDTGLVKQTEIDVEAGDDLEEETGLPAYEGWVVEEINRDPDHVVFENGETVEEWEETDTDRQGIWRDQLYQTIRSHIQRQHQLDAEGEPVKVLSLFFVDRVADYEGDEAVLPKLFDEAYAEAVKKFHKGPPLPEASEVRTAYFARGKSGEAKDVGTGFSQRKGIEARAYDLIIANKEKILVRSEPAAFIFSHSALREGWDNPNVFQACFLRHVRSPVERRQQIGRGLRLAVREDGKRLLDSELNRLTVVVDESFVEFRDALRKEYETTEGTGRRKTTKDNSPDITDDDRRIEVRRRTERFGNTEFSELWERIRYRARYRVDFDSDALVAAVLASEEIKALKSVRVTANRVTTGRLKFDKKGGISTTDPGGDARGVQISRIGSLPDPIRLVEDRLQSSRIPLNLTRKTIGEIVAGAPFKDRAVRQPEQWCAILARAIQDVAIEQMVDGIVYEPLPKSDWWDAEVVFADPIIAFDKDEPDPGAPWMGVVETDSAGPNLYTHLVHDSRVERNFGSNLDDNADVRVFCKLPRRFRIDTPVGTYAPDFAIAVDRDGTERLYLIRETKADLNLKNLEWDEALKIRFATRHFDAAPVPAVDYDHTTDAAGIRLPEE
ncbi:restriction endonuclease [Patulibacter sp. S7RM1-6]